MKEKEILLDYFKKEERTQTKRNRKTTKKTYLKKGLEKFLIGVNAIIICFTCMIEDFNFIGFLILLGLLVVLVVNALIISKWGRLLKDDELETI